ncbi:hypothetical protein ACFC7A_31625 [Streptomyces niveus]|uniref:hypothetical protein n=1 Tax=Streptomyces niveus TaxID=193462 RepID=UPI0035E35675
MPGSKAQRDLALAVSVVKRWTEVERGESTPADVILEAWSPWIGSSSKMRFDPDRIAAVVGCRRGETMGVYDIDDWEWVDGGARRRIRFIGRPSKRFAAQLDAPAPTWKQGEGTPLKVLLLDDLLEGEAAPAEERHVVLGGAVVTLDSARHLVVSVPGDYRVTVHARPSEASTSSTEE